MTKKSARFASLIVLVVLLVGVVLAAPPQAASGTPQYTKDGELLRPADYRDWVFLSSGFGMSYSPSGHAMFTNVFVPRPAYEQFLNTGKWPEKTMFVVEERDSSNKGSIVKSGNFQSKVITFRTRREYARIELPRYFSAMAASFAANIALMYLFVSLLGMWYLAASFAVAVLLVMVNFLTSDLWSFRARP